MFLDLYAVHPIDPKKHWGRIWYPVLTRFESCYGRDNYNLPCVPHRNAKIGESDHPKTHRTTSDKKNNSEWYVPSISAIFPSTHAQLVGHKAILRPGDVLLQCTASWWLECRYATSGGSCEKHGRMHRIVLWWARLRFCDVKEEEMSYGAMQSWRCLYGRGRRGLPDLVCQQTR